MSVRVGKLEGKLRRLALPLFEGDVTAAWDPERLGLGRLDAELQRLVRRALAEKAFKGADGEILLLVPERPRIAGALVLVGLGASAKWSLESLRRLAGVLARRFGRDGNGSVGLILDGRLFRERVREVGWRRAGQACAEGWVIGSYVFDRYKSEAPGARRKRASSLRLLVHGLRASEARLLRLGASRGAVIGEGVNFSRDLSNAPANDLYPEVLASRARSMARGSGLRAAVLGKRELQRLGMGAMLGVGQGSDRPPCLIVLQYRPRKQAAKTLALVGKAITFDSGGLSIKPAKGMEEMKFDMSGGAAVLGAMQAVARLALPLRVVGVIPACENMINGLAMRPGDVLRSAAGKTIEVVNTDAEGRLVLADALHYAARFKPDYVLDLATLTGACVVALGTRVSGMVTNDRDLGKLVFEAGERSGERVWELPLYDEFIEATKSQVADIKNSAGRFGGAITAAAFLSHFVSGTRWCHLDIAGTAWSERDAGYFAAGATGFGVRLVADLAETLAGNGGDAGN
jgi:leucyl aminopeptidase